MRLNVWRKNTTFYLFAEQTAMMIKKNIGRLDQALRLMVSFVLVYISIIDTTIISDPLSSMIIAGIGIINLFVALIRFCPLYAVTHINTCGDSCDSA